MSDRLAVLHAGKVVQVGTPSEVYSQPATSYVATFLGTTNLFSGDRHRDRRRRPHLPGRPPPSRSPAPTTPPPSATT